MKPCVPFLNFFHICVNYEITQFQLLYYRNYINIYKTYERKSHWKEIPTNHHYVCVGNVFKLYVPHVILVQIGSVHVSKQLCSHDSPRITENKPFFDKQLIWCLLSYGCLYAILRKQLISIPPDLLWDVFSNCVTAGVSTCDKHLPFFVQYCVNFLQSVCIVAV